MNAAILKKHGHKYTISPSGCWEWTGAVHRLGYGYFQYSGKKYPAHWIHMAPRPKGKEACHKCDNKRCINPNHLWWGTRSENMQDMVSKKRYNLKSKLKHVHVMHQKRPRPSGEANGNHKLTSKDVLIIMTQIESGKTQQSIAEDFGIADSLVSRIKNGVRWSSVTGVQKTGGKAT